VNFFSDLAGFVDRLISEMLHFKVIDPSAGRVSTIPVRFREGAGFL
jgi:hypothetical protein